MSTHRPGPAPALASSAALIDTVGTSVVGEGSAIETPYGSQRLIYADYTASGRSLSFIENFIREQVMPLYGNTHTESSATGLATTRLREEAREIVRATAGAGDDAAVIFTGSGCTAAIDKLIGILALRIPAALNDRYGFAGQIPEQERPVVFVGPYEHHSNELAWRETIADVVEIPADDAGQIDLAALEAELLLHRDRPMRIGSFSAASNVTGVITDTAAVARMLHTHDALAFFDFAAAGPYLDIDMDNPPDGAASKDAVFLSPHKFIGGPGTPGVLVVRKSLLQNRVPVVPGGGTVEFVTEDAHAYLTDPEVREEGGTPAIVESIRAGLVMQLKQAIGTRAIREREHALLGRAVERWRVNPALKLLGDSDADRLAIVSFTVRAPSGRLLHHNFVSAVLNDLFGIQSRGGCSCAGPYGHRLLGIDPDQSTIVRQAISSGWSGFKPGWVRLNLNYFITDDVASYIIDAVDLLAREGFRLLPDYRFDPVTGLWRHRDDAGQAPLRLADVQYRPGGRVLMPQRVCGAVPSLAEQLERARQILAAAPAEPAVGDWPVQWAADGLDWFELPAGGPPLSVPHAGQGPAW